MSLQARELEQATTTVATVERGVEDARLLTARDVAILFHVPISWVYERTRRRGSEQLPHVKLGKYLRFEEAAVLDFVRRQRCA